MTSSLHGLRALAFRAVSTAEVNLLLLRASLASPLEEALDRVLAGHCELTTKAREEKSEGALRSISQAMSSLEEPCFLGFCIVVLRTRCETISAVQRAESEHSGSDM